VLQTWPSYNIRIITSIITEPLGATLEFIKGLSLNKQHLSKNNVTELATTDFDTKNIVYVINRAHKREDPVHFESNTMLDTKLEIADMQAPLVLDLKWRVELGKCIDATPLVLGVSIEDANKEVM
jgi:uncharacterized protein (UPF0335 family)